MWDQRSYWLPRAGTASIVIHSLGPSRSCKIELPVRSVLCISRTRPDDLIKRASGAKINRISCQCCQKHRLIFLETIPAGWHGQAIAKHVGIPGIDQINMVDLILGLILVLENIWNENHGYIIGSDGQPGLEVAQSGISFLFPFHHIVSFLITEVLMRDRVVLPVVVTIDRIARENSRDGQVA